MATPKQIEANRLNALKSTGPRSAEGKAAVRFNSLRHGLRARTVVMPGESLARFRQLSDDLESEWQPQTRLEHACVEQMAVSLWQLARLEAAEAALVRQDATAPLLRVLPRLHRFWQDQDRLERAFTTFQRELRRLQTTRMQASAPVMRRGASAPLLG